MKKRAFAIAMAALLTLSLAGCGKILVEDENTVAISDVPVLPANQTED